MGNSEKTNKKQNRGFSLITVMVSVSFVGILGMLVLYIAMSNFNMKMTDMKGKDSFYTAERALEEICTGLQSDVGEAMSEAYIQVLESYDMDKEDVPEGSSDAAVRQTRFQLLYLQRLTDRLKKDADTDQYDLEYLKKYLDHTEEQGMGEDESLLVVNPEGKDPVMKSDDTGVLLKNIKVIHVDPKGRASVISTDIRLGIPSANFPEANTHAELTSMSVIADKGLVCDPGTRVTIDGNVYAGRQKEDPAEYDSVEIREGATLSLGAVDKFVSGGEIKVKLNGNFDVAVGVKLWAKGVSLSSATVSLKGLTYLSDDLTVESGTGSKVTLAGDYYGYGSPTSAKAGECLNKVYYTSDANSFKDADLSSAIVINGKNTTMDLSDLNRLMVSGRSYIASSKVNAVSERSNNDVITGESITVKGTQLAYLLPSQLLGDDTSSGVMSDGTSSEGTTEAQAVLTNPMTYDTYLEYLGEEGVDEMPIMKNRAVAAWGNKTLEQIGVDEKKPVKCVFYNDNTAGEGGYVYFYLNFTDDMKAAEFMNTYYYPSTKEKMDQYLSFYFGDEENSGIITHDKGAYMRLVTNGNILSYKGATGELQEPTQASYNDNILSAEQIKLQNTWYALNRKMVENVNLLEKDVKYNDKFDHDETDSDRRVFDNMINEELIKEKIAEGSHLEFTTENGLKATILNNPDTPYVITNTEAENLRLVVCRGDVVVDNTAFKGVILTKGKLTFKGTQASLETAPMDVSLAYQAVGADGLTPGSFFWDGAENAPTGMENDNTANDLKATSGTTDGIFNLADCVSYENWKKQ